MSKKLFLSGLALVICTNFVCFGIGSKVKDAFNQELKRLKKILNISDVELNYISKTHLKMGDFEKLDCEIQKRAFYFLPVFTRAQALAKQKFNKSLLELNDSENTLLRVESFSSWGFDESQRGDNSKEPKSRELNQNIRKDFAQLISDFDENTVVLFSIGCYIGVYNRAAKEIDTWPMDATLQQLPPYLTSAASKYKKNKFKVFLLDTSFGSEFDTDVPLSLRASSRIWVETMKKENFVRCYNNENIDVYVIPMYVNLGGDVDLILNASEKAISKNGVGLIINFGFPELDKSFDFNIKHRIFGGKKFFYWYFFDNLHAGQYPKINLVSFNDKEIVIENENDILKANLMLLKRSLITLKSKLSELKNKLNILESHLVQKNI